MRIQKSTFSVLGCWNFNITAGEQSRLPQVALIPSNSHSLSLLSVMDLTSLNISLKKKRKRKENLTSERHCKQPFCLLCISQWDTNKVVFDLRNNRRNWSDAETMPLDSFCALFIAGIYICGTYMLNSNNTKRWTFQANPPFGIKWFRFNHFMVINYCNGTIKACMSFKTSLLKMIQQVMTGWGSMKFILTCTAWLRVVHHKRKMKRKAGFLGYHGRTKSLEVLWITLGKSFEQSLKKHTHDLTLTSLAGVSQGCSANSCKIWKSKACCAARFGRRQEVQINCSAGKKAVDWRRVVNGHTNDWGKSSQQQTVIGLMCGTACFSSSWQRDSSVNNECDACMNQNLHFWENIYRQREIGGKKHSELFQKPTEISVSNGLDNSKYHGTFSESLASLHMCKALTVQKVSQELSGMIAVNLTGCEASRGRVLQAELYLFLDRVCLICKVVAEL